LQKEQELLKENSDLKKSLDKQEIMISEMLEKAVYKEQENQQLKKEIERLNTENKLFIQQLNAERDKFLEVTEKLQNQLKEQRKKIEDDKK
jgi:hypothetical protein